MKNEVEKIPKEKRKKIINQKRIGGKREWSKRKTSNK